MLSARQEQVPGGAPRVNDPVHITESDYQGEIVQLHVMDENVPARKKNAVLIENDQQEENDIVQEREEVVFVSNRQQLRDNLFSEFLLFSSR